MRYYESMRRLVLASLILGLSACGSGGPTSPQALINVRVSDDIGAPVDRMPVRVTMSAAERFEGSTGRGGTARIEVSGAGTYEVKVIPRDGYLAGPEPLLKTVIVESNGTSTVTFTVHRVGVSTADPKPTECGKIIC